MKKKNRPHLPVGYARPGDKIIPLGGIVDASWKLAGNNSSPGRKLRRGGKLLAEIRKKPVGWRTKTSLHI